MPNSLAFNMDCMDAMKQFPDKYFDLDVVDPPYGIGFDAAYEKTGGTKYGNACAAKKIYHTANWDSSTPSDDYFIELFRVSKNQVVWGGNYFKQLPPSKAFICWDKRFDGITRSFADCEYALENMMPNSSDYRIEDTELPKEET